MFNKNWILTALLATAAHGSVLRVRQDMASDIATPSGSAVPSVPTDAPFVIPTSGVAEPTGAVRRDTATASDQPDVTTDAPQPPGGEPTATPGGDGGAAAAWEQCGGVDFTGPTTCAEGTCTKIDEYYHQCIPDDAGQQPPQQPPQNPEPQPGQPQQPQQPEQPQQPPQSPEPQPEQPQPEQPQS